MNLDEIAARAAGPAAPPGLRFIRAVDVPASPWKNGGGTTRELLRLPAAGAGAGDWALRISLADIAADGPFSPFPGVTRWFSVVDGAGVHLAWTGEDGLHERRVAIGPEYGPLRFDGGDAPDCRLLDGPTRDLNVMARDGAATAEVVPAALDKPCGWAGGLRGVFTLQPVVLQRGAGAGATRHAPRGAAALPLPAHTLVWSDGADASTWWLSPSPDVAMRLGAPATPALWIAATLVDRR